MGAISDRLVAGFAATVDRAVRARAIDATDELIGHRLLVLAPHPDDETLACGGVIAEARRSGHDVAVLVATDGTNSHPPEVIDPGELAAIRAAELTEATARLGVDPEAVHRLDLPDGRLSELHQTLVADIARFDARWKPDVVLVPSGRDWNPDHRALAAAARAALRNRRRAFAYPVWFYEPWAWYDPGASATAKLGQVATRLARAAATARPVTADIDASVATKVRAIEAYRSQLVAPNGRTDWPVLPDALIDRAGADTELYFRGYGP